MKTKVSTKISSLVLALAIALTAVFATAVPAEAAVKGSTLKGATLADKSGTATAGQEVRVPFTVPSDGNVKIYIVVQNPTATTLSLYNGSGVLLSDYENNPLEVSASSYIDASSMGIPGYVYLDTWTLPQGDYEYGFTFADGTNYVVEVDSDAVAAKPELNQTKATITAGFTKKLSVTDGKAKSWSSSNKKVATVDKNGKVTAKKKGKATITVKCTDGTELRCKVTVKANQYTARKITTGDVSYGDTGMDAYKVSFDKKGNLVIKTRFVNKLSYRVTALKKIKITVKDVNGKTVGTYKLSKKNVSVSSGSTKDFTFTIKKSGLKKKKADLRGGRVTGSYTAQYIYRVYR